MIAALKPGVTLDRLNSPVVETERLILRPWRNDDIAPNTAMLGDPVAGRFITADGKPITDVYAGWRNAAIMAGHWALYGIGMFVVEEKQTGRFVGRVGPWRPPGWPGFEVGWGIAADLRGKGYAVEAARASIDWSFATFESIGSSIASTAKTSARKLWRDGWVPKRMARPSYWATSRMSG